MTEGTKIYLCPECGSPAIERSLISGATSSCRGCSWAGSADRLVVLPVAGETGSDLLVAMINDLRGLLSGPLGLVLLQFCTKWGFINVKTDKKVMARQLGRYAAASARGIMTALFEERNKMEAERAAGS